MKEWVRVQGVRAVAGGKAAGYLELPGPERVRVPVVIANGVLEGPTLVVTAGIHGGEYAAIEAAGRFAAAVDPETLRGAAVVLPVVNPPAYFARTVYVSPLDGKNLNRVFPGRPGGSPSERLAHLLTEEVFAIADVLVDLHGGDLNEALEPFVVWSPVGNARLDQVARDLATGFGIRYVVSGGVPGAAFVAAARAGVPAILAEAGQQGMVDEASVGLLLRGLGRTCRRLGMARPGAGWLDGLDPAGTGVSLPDPAGVVEVPELLWHRSEHDGMWYPAVRPGERVVPGQALGRITDLFGRPLQAPVAGGGGTVLFTVTSLAINRGDPLVGIADTTGTWCQVSCQQARRRRRPA